jgi:imidazole glycerol-phosphate synthase subunit HisH
VPTVAIVDYGTGNVASLEEAFAAVGAKAYLATTPDAIHLADALVLPGVGHFGQASLALRHNGCWEPLITLVRQGMPTLGICLGFQLLTRSSEEASDVPGLGLLADLCTIRIRPGNPRRYKVPHLGWNSLDQCSGPPSLLAEITPERQLFYFANAYAVPPVACLSDPHAAYNHGSSWLALVQQGNLCGVQFHPEKSRQQGLQLLHNFLQLA